MQVIATTSDDWCQFAPVLGLHSHAINGVARGGSQPAAQLRYLCIHYLKYQTNAIPGGWPRKMSGGAFSKLLNRLAGQGYDLSIPLDLKDHWAKHQTVTAR
ncbi:hypothetical protein HAX54_052139 [Datura stramonium]|uniref:GAGA-binding transcriptional activator n=1 Tax=Datura stramonium TaxID=4076 RepID=A0ABS8RRU1_DATST|nr:hypothetical protein [Datura stramonium]